MFCQRIRIQVSRNTRRSDTIWAFPDGKLTIGPNAFCNTGKWNHFSPGNN